MILGITGKTGAGKHTAAKYLASKGWIVLDGDTIAHSLYAPDKPVWHELVRVFSEAILKPDRTIDRQKLHDLVFSAGDFRDNLKKLNAIVHPPLQAELKSRVAELRRLGKQVVVVGALWKQLDFPSLVDKMVVIRAFASTACDRILKRDKIDRQAFLARWNAQALPETPDAVIDNHGTLEDFHGAIDSALAQL